MDATIGTYSCSQQITNNCVSTSVHVSVVGMSFYWHDLILLSSVTIANGGTATTVLLRWEINEEMIIYFLHSILILTEKLDHRDIGCVPCFTISPLIIYSLILAEKLDVQMRIIAFRGRAMFRPSLTRNQIAERRSAAIFTGLNTGERLSEWALKKRFGNKIRRNRHLMFSLFRAGIE